jgi:hypothetical protein
MARLKKEDYPAVVTEILEGKHDADLDYIAQACKARVKRMFRRGQRVTITECSDPKLRGREAVVVKVNQKTVSIAVGEATFSEWDTGKEFPHYDGGEWNFPPTWLAPVSA